MKTALFTSLLLLVPVLTLAQESSSLGPGNSRDLEADYGTAILDIEAGYGPYDAQLIEPLESLGRLLGERGDHAQALQVYGRLLHLNRINSGFYDQSHLPIVDKIIESTAALQNWTQLDESHDYLFWLYQRAHQNDGEKLREGTARLLGWKLSYLGLVEQGDRSKQLLELEDLADEQIELLRDQRGEQDPLLVPALYQRALLHYAYAVALDENDATGRRLLEREAPQLQHRDPASRQSVFGLPRDSLLTNEEVHPLIMQQLHQGRHLLEKIRAIAESMGDSPQGREARALAELHLADWDLLMDRRGAALDGYRRSYQLLKAADVAEQDLATFFARPLVIPRAEYLRELPRTTEETAQSIESDTAPIRLEDYVAWSGDLPGLSFPQASAPSYVAPERATSVELEFAIELRGKRFKTRAPHFSTFTADTGNVEQVNIVDDEALGDVSRGRARDEAELLTFRPRLKNGEPVATERARMKFIFSPGT
jgi:hypothetical protein